MKYLRAALTFDALGALALGFVGIATLLQALNSVNLPLLVTGIIVLALGLAYAFQAIGLLETVEAKAKEKHQAVEDEEKVND